MKEKVSSYELQLPEVRHGRTIYIEPAVKPKKNVRFREITTLQLQIDYGGDFLEFEYRTEPDGEIRIKKVPISKYTGGTLDSRLSRLTPEQKQRLIEDTGIPVEELDEIASIEKENEAMLGKLLFDQYK